MSSKKTDKHPYLSNPVKIRLLPHYGNFDLPEYQSDMASGFDLLAAIENPIYIKTGGSPIMIPTGLCFEIPKGFEGQVRPRSGLAAKGIVAGNAPGTIDADYRGEVKVLLCNNSSKKFCVEPGMRIAQMVIAPVVQARFKIVSSLSKTNRGEGGFGSTGLKNEETQTQTNETQTPNETENENG